MSTFLIQSLLFIPGLLMFFGLPWLIWRGMRSRRPSINPLPITHDEAGGRIIPLKAAFSGVRALPWIAFATNSLNPRLVFTPTGVTYRVLGTTTRPYGDIEQVDVLGFGATVNLTFAFRGSAITFAGNVGSIILAARALALLPTGVPLSDRAKALLDPPAPMR